MFLYHVKFAKVHSKEKQHGNVDNYDIVELQSLSNRVNDDEEATGSVTICRLRSPSFPPCRGSRTS